jgi:hypothetical protein
LALFDIVDEISSDIEKLDCAKTSMVKVSNKYQKRCDLSTKFDKILRKTEIIYFKKNKPIVQLDR